jgi:FKBP-type peptidyl-prolyl cis-trans isomerase 2
MIAKGSTVSIHYTLKVDGEKLESSKGSDPLVFRHGEGQLIPGLEEELEGLKPGESREITVPPDKAYGPHKAEHVHAVDKQIFRNREEVEVGAYVEGKTREGEPFRAKVVDEKEDSFVLDLNHPLAGKTLAFQVEVVSVQS